MSVSGFWRCAFFILLSVCLAACNSKVSLDNYNKLRVGQPFEEVKQILGDPARCDETLGVRTCLWGDEQRSISINFVAGQVLLLSAKNLK